MRNSHGRRIALQRPKRAEVEAIIAELARIEAEGTEPARAKAAALRAELDRLERRRRVIAFVDPVDIRFNRFEAQPLP